MVPVYRILSKFAFQLSNSFQEIWTFAKQMYQGSYSTEGIEPPLGQHPIS